MPSDIADLYDFWELDTEYWDLANEVDAQVEDVNRLLELDGYLRAWVLA